MIEWPMVLFNHSLKEVSVFSTSLSSFNHLANPLFKN